MSTLYGTSTHRIVYKAGGFATGKTVTAYIWNPSLVKSAEQTLTEVSDGLYYLDYTFAVLGTHFGEFYENGVAMTVGTFRILALATETTVTIPIVATAGLLVLIRGDDYKAADERALEWSSTSWPALGGAAIALTIRDQTNGAAVLTATGSVTAAGPGEQTIQVELTAAQTAVLSVVSRKYQFDVQATLASGSIVTLVRGGVNVYGDQTR